MKLTEVEINLFLYGLVNFFDEGAGLANEQHFFLRILREPVDQPFDLLFEGGAFVGGWVERVENRLALGESFELFAGVAKHDATGAKAVDQFFH